MHGGQQFRTKQTEAAVVTGHLVRLLDTSSCAEEQVVADVTRLVAELIHTGANPKTVAKAITRVSREAHCNISEVRGFCEWPASKRLSWMECFDGLEIRSRLRDSMRLLVHALH